MYSLFIFSYTVLTLPKHLPKNKVLFRGFLHNFLAFVILLILPYLPPISFWNSDVFVSSFNFGVLSYNILPKLEHVPLLNSIPNDSGFLNMNDEWFRSPLGVVHNIILLINWSSVLSNPEELFCWYSLKLKMIPHTLLKVSVWFPYCKQE